MKTIIFLILLSCMGCEYYTEDFTVSCGYNELPYYEAPYSCQSNPWTVEGGECCTWYMDEYYSECAEVWCYNEYICAWQLYDYSCYPI